MMPAMSTRTSLLLALSLSIGAACGSDPGTTEGTDATTVDTTGGTTLNTSGETTGGTSGDSTGDTGGEPTTGEAHVVPEFGNTFTVIGTAEHGLNAVRDLAFNPVVPSQLWTYNMLSHGTVIFFEPGTEQQTSEERIDAYGQHFMAYVSSAAFADNGNFATC